MEGLGADLRRLSFPHDGHWSPYEHQMDAQAMRAWLEKHIEVCGGEK